MASIKQLDNAVTEFEIQKNDTTGQNVLKSARTRFSLVVPDEVDELGYGCFCNNEALASVEIGGKIKTIPVHAFFGCSNLEKVMLKEGVETIREGAFEDCYNLREIYMPNSLRAIGHQAFVSCLSLPSLYIKSGLSEMCSDSFLGTYELERIVVDLDNKTYDSRNDCNAIIETATNTLIKGCKNTIIPKGVETIGREAFGSCIGLKKIVIPDGVTRIKRNAFSLCMDLNEVHLPSSLESIGEYAFYHCPKLKIVHYAGTEQQWKKVQIKRCNDIVQPIF